ncbi:thiamine phosphate synthase [Gulosibacter chungangensis]|uniref:Thiamine-phosphate synthase n=1 Tax=Gulosibacter chungangensis TaxID=979746 RepID=A0A7J5BCI2_9MICO|nr:thiamine phosphate synthase [Gulosibacter chungangensis]KAB1643915.1 thiamine phosphate synthase [Gulosibacter chungangensis]
MRQRVVDALPVYLVTDDGLCAAEGRTVVDTVRAAVDGGVTCVQLRGKTLSARELLQQTLEVAAAVGDRVPVLVNDRVDVYLTAREAGAAVAGVHIGQSDLPVELTRAVIGPDAILGLSAATPQQLANITPGTVDYVGIGPVHSTATKPDAPTGRGLEWAAGIVTEAPVPAVAIGGLRAADLEALKAAGFAGAAVVSAICSATDPEAAARALAERWAAHPAPAPAPAPEPTLASALSERVS